MAVSIYIPTNNVREFSFFHSLSSICCFDDDHSDQSDMTNLKIAFSSSVKNIIGNLIGIALNLYITLGSIVIYTILILPIQEHEISFPLLVSSLISFISNLQFSE